MKICNNEMYLNDLYTCMKLSLPWYKLKNKIIVISGATGLIGSFLIDILLEKNIEDNLNCTIYALGRDKHKVQDRFSKYSNKPYLKFQQYDVQVPLDIKDVEKVDYILHLASNTHPLLYSTDPIGTITTNVIGAKNMLDFAVTHNAERVLLASSVEIYGENRGDKELFDEDYCGYINCNTMRAGYPESKRCSEALCQAYKQQKGLNVVIARIARTFGPTMNMSDTKAASQFIKKGVLDEDIVLKSQGNQYYSYTYVSDVASGLLYTLLLGDNGEAYNISDESGDITLKDLAETVAKMNGRNVIFEIPDEIEVNGYSKATKARLNGNKLKKLGWNPVYDVREGIKRTVTILKDIMVE